MKKHIVLAGGSGLMGRILARHFLQRNIPVTVLTRGKGGERDGVSHVRWDPEHPRDLEQHLNGALAVIGLAGASVDRRYNAKGRWNILHSRIGSTLAIGDAIARCTEAPEAWLQLSTATIYRHAEDRAMDQYTGELGEGFSVEVARTWEAVANSFTLPHTRTALLRSSMVLSLGWCSATAGAAHPRWSGAASTLVVNSTSAGSMPLTSVVRWTTSLPVPMPTGSTTWPRRNLHATVT
ncbi:MAG: NAD-dependent epimerase/dehydratase family protein [Flavobacteriales bacterium]|nr:NAD-dependent epimerase/dehydratase family protein [Flavobacteriales bacterium]